MWAGQNLYQGEKVTKDDPRVLKLKEWVDKQYAEGRVTTISTSELMAATGELGI